MSSKASTPKPLAFMETLSPIVSFYQPPPTTTPTKTTTLTPPPKLILFASWTGAQDLHIAKYLARHRTLYPTSPILLIKSPPQLLTLKPHTLPTAVSPAVPIIHSLFPPGTTSPSQPELLVHFLSNGGSSSLASLYTALAPAVLPPHTTFIDSAPSEIALHTSAQFFIAFAPRSGLLRTLYIPIAYLLAGVLVAGVSAGILVEWIKVWGATHNVREGGNKLEVRRTYVYSEEDRLVDYRCVERHAAEARERGFEVRMERFVGTAHVLHARGDGEARYWGLVEETWEAGRR